MVDLNAQYLKLGDEIDNAIKTVLNSTAFIKGPEVRKFEEDLQKYLSCRNVISCANGTDALQIAMMALGLKPGDEVIMPSYTFVSTANAFVLRGAVPVFVDIRPDTLNLDEGKLERLITPIIEKARSNGALVASLTSSIVATNIITADQYIAIVLPGRMFKSAFARRGLAPVVLSRTVGDTATPTSALIPWNSCGAYMAATLGVATWSYAPYAVFSYVSPLLTIALAYAGFRMLRVN